MNHEYTHERPANTTVNIQWGRPISCISIGEPCSTSSSPIDSSLPSKMDYAECVQLQNNMDVKEDNKPIPLVQSGPVRTANPIFPAP